MNLHEYQAKQLFKEYGIPIPPGKPVNTPDEAITAAKALGGELWVVKAQVHAGGRGKVGGVKLCKSPEAVRETAGQMLGTRLVTKQSAPHGQPVNRVLVQAASEIARELYLSMLVDRPSKRIVVVASQAGGMDIEEVAAITPERIHTMAIDPILGLQAAQCRQLGFDLDLNEVQRGELAAILAAMHRLFVERDLSLIEINPLIVDPVGRLEALDAKVAVDDNALYRQAIAKWRDETQEDPREAAARKHDLNYVTLDGDIACMVNGAGLAMATMDIIKLYGGRPANFLDVGGGTTAERVAEAFKLIVSDHGVRAILVNIFGGIVRCDLIAEGIIRAVNEVGVKVPVVVRLEGTNVEQGRAALSASGLSIIAAEDLSDAARKVVEAAGEKG